MLTIDRTGIICDNCGLALRSEFSYYSFDFKKVEVYNNSRPSLQHILSLDNNNSKDICSICFAAIRKTIIQNYSSQMGPKHRPPAAHTTCEMTGKKMTGSYEYYYCVVSFVKVNIVGQPSYCVSCKTATFNKDKPCSKCGSRQFITPAKVDIDNRYLEFALCDESHARFVAKAEEIRQKQNNWSTRSS
jgi:hypothetical protein